MGKVKKLTELRSFYNLSIFSDSCILVFSKNSNDKLYDKKYIVFCIPHY